MVSATQNDHISEEANNVYSLPSIPQTITYLHAAAGFPVKETWMDAIKQKLHNVAKSYNIGGSKTLSRLQQNSERSHEKTTPRS